MPARHPRSYAARQPTARLRSLAIALGALAVLAAACGDSGQSPASDPTTSLPTSTLTSTAAAEVTVPSNAAVIAAFAAAVVAGDRSAAAAVAAPEVIDLLEPWEPEPGASVFDEHSTGFFIQIGSGDIIGCDVGEGSVQGCGPLIEEGQVDDEPEGTYQRIDFPPGEFGTFVSGAVVLGERNTYYVEAEEGQSLILGITSVEDNAVYDVFSPRGVLLAGEQTGGAILLPDGGGYEIVVGGTRGNASYDLDIFVFPTERVRFDADAIGTTVSSAIVRGERAVYLLGAAAGQTMEISITSLEDNAVVDVYAPSGPPLATEVTTDSILLPEGGDYQIVVAATRANATFDLDVTIVGG